MKTENKFYITYGTSDRFPFKGGWSTVIADREVMARLKHLDRHGFSEDGSLRFAFSYSSDEWEAMDMKTKGNLGAFEHEIIR